MVGALESSDLTRVGSEKSVGRLVYSTTAIISISTIASG
jgi:hypothetical protein